MKNKWFKVTVIAIIAIFALCLLAYSAGLSRQAVIASRIFGK